MKTSILASDLLASCSTQAMMGVANPSASQMYRVIVWGRGGGTSHTQKQADANDPIAITMSLPSAATPVLKPLAHCLSNEPSHVIRRGCGEGERFVDQNDREEKRMQGVGSHVNNFESFAIQLLKPRIPT